MWYGYYFCCGHLYQFQKSLINSCHPLKIMISSNTVCWCLEAPCVAETKKKEAGLWAKWVSAFVLSVKWPSASRKVSAYSSTPGDIFFIGRLLIKWQKTEIMTSQWTAHMPQGECLRKKYCNRHHTFAHISLCLEKEQWKHTANNPKRTVQVFSEICFTFLKHVLILILWRHLFYSVFFSQ